MGEIMGEIMGEDTGNARENSGFPIYGRSVFSFMSQLVVGNWKMNGSRVLGEDLARAIRAGASDHSSASVVLCPPFPYLESVGRVLEGSRVALGAQDVSEHAPGAFTGEVSAEMLADLGCEWVIVGHSERRALHQESNHTVAAKARAALRAGLRPIVCVGETLADRESNRTESVLAAQLEPLIDVLLESQGGAVLAYEPVWAIGTGRTASPAQAAEVHRFLRTRFVAAGGQGEALQILYGGSVKPDNARELFAVSGIDGGLIGGASLKASEFLSICAAAVAAHSLSGVS
jgi:triosephosphate isomerase